MTKLLRDRRGTSTVSYVLLLPLFILVVFGSLQMWRIISIKQSLHVGVYQTVRCISMYDARGTTLAGCESLLDGKLSRNGLLNEPAVERTIEYYRWDAESRQWIRIGDPTTPDIPECGIPFRMKVELSLPWNIVIPYLPARQLTLHQWKASYVECPTGWSPISEGTPITPLN